MTTPAWQARAARWVPPTLRQMIGDLQANINDAARREADARAAARVYQPGDERLGMAIEDTKRYVAEQKHWREYLAYYRGLLERHPGLADKPAEEAIKRDRAAKPAPVRMGAVIPLPNPPAENDISDDDIPS